MNTFSSANKRDLIITGDARTGAFREEHLVPHFSVAQQFRPANYLHVQTDVAEPVGRQAGMLRVLIAFWWLKCEAVTGSKLRRGFDGKTLEQLLKILDRV